MPPPPPPPPLLQTVCPPWNLVVYVLRSLACTESEFCDHETVQTALEYCQLLALSKDDLGVGLVAVQTVLDDGRWWCVVNLAHAGARL